MIDSWGSELSIGNLVNFRFGDKYLKGKLVYMDEGKDRIDVFADSNHVLLTEP